MQKVLITGANGFIGGHLVRALVGKELLVVATGRGSSKCEVQSDRFIYEALDFVNDQEVKKIFENYRPDIVIHAGAMSKPDECEQNKEAAFRTNVSGTVSLLTWAEAFKSFFVFLSTDFVFSGEKERYSEEDTDTFPVNYYGETKLMAENRVKDYGFDWAIVRTVLVFGPSLNSRLNIVTNTARSLKEGRPLKIFNDQYRTPTYVGDLVSGIVAIVEKRKTGIFHIAGKDICTPYQIATAVAGHMGANASLITPVEEKDFEQPARRPRRTIFNIEKSIRELNYQPLSFEEGLKATLR